jgi:type IV secretory pathway TrbF-like protein
MSIFDSDDLLRINRHLTWIAVAGGAVIISLATALLVLALKPKLPPYVIAVDHGKIVGYTQVFTGDSQLGEAIVEDKIREFIYDSRVVTANREFEIRNIDTVYAMARGQATRWLETYYRASPDNDPIKLGHKGDWRSVDITRVLKEPTEGGYRVEWQETLHPRTGEPATSYWEATLRIITGPPDTRTDLNPIGLFVISIDAQQAQMEAKE